MKMRHAQQLNLTTGGEGLGLTVLEWTYPVGRLYALRARRLRGPQLARRMRHVPCLQAIGAFAEKTLVAAGH
ncbi:hypothetical protein ACVB8X_31940 [Streptomyces sp. NRAIS4]